MKPPMNHTAYKVAYTRSGYGDYVRGAETAIICHFRVISELVQNSAETVQSDAMAWFEPDSDIQKGDIIAFQGIDYIVERLTEARRLRDTSIQFIKTELLKYGAIS